MQPLSAYNHGPNRTHSISSSTVANNAKTTELVLSRCFHANRYVLIDDMIKIKKNVKKIFLSLTLQHEPNFELNGPRIGFLS